VINLIYKVTFNLSNPSIIPFNNKYKISSFLYNLIEKEDIDLFDKLHNNKLQLDGRPITPFVFSSLFFKDAEIFRSHGFLVQGEGTWYFATPITELQTIFEKNISKGLLIGNILLTVTSVQKIDINTDNSVFKTLSPIVVNIKQNNKTHQLEPNEPTYINRLKDNIIRKYKYLYNKTINRDDFDIKILSYDLDGSLEYYKDRHIKSYPCIIEVIGDKTIKETILNMGVGCFNSMGFGFVLPLRGDKYVV